MRRGLLKDDAKGKESDPWELGVRGLSGSNRLILQFTPT